MKHLFDEYGELILEMLGTAAIVGLLIVAVYQGGFVQDFIERVTQAAC